MGTHNQREAQKGAQKPTGTHLLAQGVTKGPQKVRKPQEFETPKSPRRYLTRALNTQKGKKPTHANERPKPNLGVAGTPQSGAKSPKWKRNKYRTK